MAVSYLDAAEKLTRAVEQNDVDAVEALYADDIIVHYNTSDVSMDRADAIASLIGLRAANQHITFTDIDRREMANGYVQMATLKGKTLGGVTFSIKTCLVATVNDQGRIVLIKEYMDSSQLTPVLAEMSHD